MRNQKRNSSGERGRSGKRTRSVEMSRRKKQKSFQHSLLGSLLAVVILAAAAVIYTAAFGLPAPIQARIDIQADRNARDGTLHAASRPVGEGEYRVVLNQLPTMEAGSRTCNIEFENPAENRYSSRINLYRKSTGKRIGGSRRVDPGKYIETLELSEDLEPGEIPVLAEIELFNKTEPAGSMTLELTVRVTE
ncbi:MAG: hypothetical protein KHZ58_14900 [Hungatella hathewayi]|nr:hypothetical protein [Hungatella hathewayi]